MREREKKFSVLFSFTVVQIPKNWIVFSYSFGFTADWKRLEFGHTWMKNRTSTFTLNTFPFPVYTFLCTQTSNAVLSSDRLRAAGLPDCLETFVQVPSGMPRGREYLVSSSCKCIHIYAQREPRSLQDQVSGKVLKLIHTARCIQWGEPPVWESVLLVLPKMIGSKSWQSLMQAY